MKKALVHRHDELAKKFLTDLSVAREFLEMYLPAKILNKCDLSSLEIQSESYIDDDLRKRFSDVVYKVGLLDGKSCAYIYTLIEHQSAAEKLMPLRVLRYELEIISNHIKIYGEDKPLPIVVPLVFYNGTDSPYPHSTSIRDLMLDKELFDLVGLGAFKLIDLTVTNDSEILKHKKIALLEMVLKHIKAKEFILVVDSIVKALIVAHADNLPKNLFHSLLSYLTKAKDEDELKPLFKSIIAEFSEYKEDIMTYAEHYTQQGIQQGMQQGMQQGVQQGEYDAQRKIVNHMLQVGLSLEEAAKQTGIPLQEIKKLIK